jgi:hypothetical protein
MGWWLVLGAVVALVITWVGGHLTPVAGKWTDGDRLLTLVQRGFLLYGEVERQGGQEIYRGHALFGRVFLKRFVVGGEYLRSLGFPADVLALMSGQVMADYRLRLASEHLRGVFQGRHFSFMHKPARIRASKPIEPRPIIFQRLL